MILITNVGVDGTDGNRGLWVVGELSYSRMLIIFLLGPAAQLRRLIDYYSS